MTSRQGARMTRRHATVVALLAAGLAAGIAAPAIAAEYPVHACQPVWGDVNHSWVAEANTPKMAAYWTCPVSWRNTAEWDQGLVTRHGVTPYYGGSVAAGDQASLRFRAPPGTILSKMTYLHSFCGGAEFKAGLRNHANTWLHASAPGTCGTNVSNPTTLPLNGTPSVRVTTVCARKYCDVSTSLRAWASMRSVTVWVADLTKPSVAITGGSIATSGWHAGNQSLTFAASDNTGIARIETYVDTKLVRAAGGTCNWTAATPCSLRPGALGFDSQVVADGVHTLVVKARDSAGNWASTSRLVHLDNTAPPGPLDLTVTGGEGWRNRNSFALEWQNPPQGGLAPINGVVYAICAPAAPLDNFSSCLTGSRTGVNVRGLTGLHVPGPGHWQLRVWLRDAAGNADASTARTVHLRYDPTAPTRPSPIPTRLIHSESASQRPTDLPALRPLRLRFSATGIPLGSRCALPAPSRNTRHTSTTQSYPRASTACELASETAQGTSAQRTSGSADSMPSCCCPSACQRR